MQWFHFLSKQPEPVLKAFLPATNPVQTMVSRSSAATREAMALFLSGLLCQLVSSGGRRVCCEERGDLQVHLYWCTRESESVICSHWLEMGESWHQMYTCPVNYLLTPPFLYVLCQHLPVSALRCKPGASVYQSIYLAWEISPQNTAMHKLFSTNTVSSFVVIILSLPVFLSLSFL